MYCGFIVNLILKKNINPIATVILSELCRSGLAISGRRRAAVVFTNKMWPFSSRLGKKGRN